MVETAKLRNENMRKSDVKTSSDSTRIRAHNSLFGFRSGTIWHQVCAWAFFAALYTVFVLTMFPPIAASNYDVMIYKIIRLLLFATPVLCVILLSNFKWCKRAPLFASERRSQRLLGTAILVALFSCLCANLMYLHTQEYQEALRDWATSLVTTSQGLSPSESGTQVPSDTPDESTAALIDVNSSSNSSDESLTNAWNDQREGCGTD